MKNRNIIILAFIVFASIYAAGLYLDNSNKNQSANHSVIPSSNEKPKLGYEIISFAPLGRLYEVKVKFTNIGSITITQAKATCVLTDNANREICFENHYVVKDDLAPGNSTYFSYVITCSKEPAHAKIHIERIR